MSLIFRLSRIGRLAIAPFKGFFVTSLKMVKHRGPRPEAPTFWAHTRQIFREDFNDMFVPFKYAVKEFRDELDRR